MKWLRSLQGLRTFWTKRIESVDIEVVDDFWRLVVRWKASRVCDRAVFLLIEKLSSLDELSANEKPSLRECRIILTTSELDIANYDRRSVVYVYDAQSKLLEPNRDVEVRIYEPNEATKEVLKWVEAVQKRSWGFYMPPVKGDFVFLAELRDNTVGAAYWNVRSGNVNYGIHVVRDLWRRRIGTRLLHEVRRHAIERGWEWFTVIRVLRGKKPTASDHRAMAF